MVSVIIPGYNIIVFSPINCLEACLTFFPLTSLWSSSYFCGGMTSRLEARVLLLPPRWMNLRKTNHRKCRSWGSVPSVAPWSLVWPPRCPYLCQSRNSTLNLHTRAVLRYCGTQICMKLPSVMYVYHPRLLHATIVN